MGRACHYWCMVMRWHDHCPWLARCLFLWRAGIRPDEIPDSWYDTPMWRFFDPETQLLYCPPLPSWICDFSPVRREDLPPPIPDSPPSSPSPPHSPPPPPRSLTPPPPLPPLPPPSPPYYSPGFHPLPVERLATLTNWELQNYFYPLERPVSPSSRPPPPIPHSVPVGHPPSSPPRSFQDLWSDDGDDYIAPLEERLKWAPFGV